MMSPYAFYQFWLNVEDEKVGELLRIFTFLTREEIEELERQTRREAVPPGRPEGAWPSRSRRSCTAPRRPTQVKAAAAALFGGGDLAGLSPATLGAALREAGADDASPASCPAWSTCWWRPAWPRARGEARRTVAEGGAYLNNERVEDPELVPVRADLIGGSWLVLRRGKKNFAGVEVA